MVHVPVLHSGAALLEPDKYSSIAESTLRYERNFRVDTAPHQVALTTEKSVIKAILLHQQSKLERLTSM